MNDPVSMTEYELVSLRCHLIENQLGDVKLLFQQSINDGREREKLLLEIIELFKASKNVVTFAATIGRITIKVSAFIVAIGAMILTIRGLFSGGTKP